MAKRSAAKRDRKKRQSATPVPENPAAIVARNFDQEGELRFVDPDIAEAFKGGSYLLGTATIAQATREIRRLSDLIARLADHTPVRQGLFGRLFGA